MINNRRQPRSVLARFHLGVAHERKRDFEEAIAHFRQATEINPEFAEARVNLVSVLIQTDRVKEAETEAREGVRQTPENALAHTALANVLLQLEQPQEALDAADRAIAIDASLEKAAEIRAKTLAALDAAAPEPGA